MTHMESICENCGLSFGAHRADATIPNQCPMHEGWMDWPTRGVTTFIDSGLKASIPSGTISKKITSQQSPCEKG